MTTLPKTILVPTDFSQNAEQALDYATALAGKLDAKVHVLNVIGMQMFGAEYGVAVTSSMVEDVMRDNQRRSTSSWRHAPRRHRSGPHGSSSATHVP